jgi:hypothetical protein
MFRINRRYAIGLMGASAIFPGAAQSQVVPFCNGLTANDCASKVRDAINNASNVDDALNAWGAWCGVYEQAYRSMAGAPVPPSDLDRAEDYVGDKIDHFTNPTSIATDLLIKKYFPMLASVLEFADGPVVTAVWLLLAPSPIQTPLQELQSTNDELSQALSIRLFPLLRSDWKTDYSSYVSDAFNGPTIGPKP